MVKTFLIFGRVLVFFLWKSVSSFVRAVDQTRNGSLKFNPDYKRDEKSENGLNEFNWSSEYSIKKWKSGNEARRQRDSNDMYVM